MVVTDETSAHGRDAKAPEATRLRRAVALRIAGKDYRVVSDADAAWLQKVASAVSDAMSLVRDRTETVDSFDVAVLTALNLARELVLLREQAHERVQPSRPGLDPARLEALIDLAESSLGGEPAA